MNQIKQKLEKLMYEISLVKTTQPDQLTGVINRLDELIDTVNALDRCQCQNPNKEPINIYLNCKGYIE